jgi:hypothetical protein
LHSSGSFSGVSHFMKVFTPNLVFDFIVNLRTHEK